MSHDDLFYDVMSIIHGDYNPCTAATAYHVPNRKIIQLETTLDYIQLQQDTPLVETYNQQEIFRWVRNHLNLPLDQGQGYNEWELSEL